MEPAEVSIQRRVLELTGRKVYGSPPVFEDTAGFFLTGGGRWRAGT